jgi:catechol 2,3-dioxygenase-like lactoylglutathione lyase family enzyme
MFSHIVVGSNDIERSKAFYDALFNAIGGSPGFVDPKNRLIYQHDGAMLMVTRPIDGMPATHANGGTIGFAVSEPAKIDAWHAAGIEAGGTSIENPPGVRAIEGAGNLYLAYLRDPDGNKLCALHRMTA